MSIRTLPMIGVLVLSSCSASADPAQCLSAVQTAQPVLESIVSHTERATALALRGVVDSTIRDSIRMGRQVIGPIKRYCAGVEGSAVMFSSMAEMEIAWAEAERTLDTLGK